MAVLEWCKLFADRKAKHHWKRIVPASNRSAFVSGLLKELGLPTAEYHAYIKSVLHYRNKFVAHLDDERTMVPPVLRVIRKSARYLYDYLLKDPLAPDCLSTAPTSARGFYTGRFRLAWQQYGAVDPASGAT
jgi:hypothetical protein